MRGWKRHKTTVDYNGDGLLSCLKMPWMKSNLHCKAIMKLNLIEQAAEKFRVIRDKVVIYVIEDPNGETDSENVFSWDIKKYFVD